MIRCGDTVMLIIEETNMYACGVAKVDDMVVFCRGAVAGDAVLALVTDVKKNYAEAKALNIVKPSGNRVEPSCPHAEECGGCSFGSVTYGHECEVKRAGIAAALRREGIRASVSDFVTSTCEDCRNKAVFHFDDQGRCGFFAPGTKKVVRIEKCLICGDMINRIKNEAERLIAENGKIAPSELTYLYIRYMKETDEASLAVGYRGKESLEKFAKELGAAVPQIKCVMRGTADSPEAKGEKFSLIYGAEYVRAKVGDIEFKVPPSSFFQVNTDGAAALCDTVVRLAGLKDGERAADIYCGGGLFALSLAKSAPGAEVYGIEINPDAVSGANRSAAGNGVSNAFFLQGDSSELRSKTGIDSLDVAVVDPPRTGLSKKTVAELERLSPKRIVYVSCNPSTLARDIKALDENYVLKEVAGVDMFPRTKHVETVVLMTKE